MNERMRDLANKLFETLDALDHYNMVDNGYTVENALKDVQEDPYAIIEYLCDAILESV